MEYSRSELIEKFRRVRRVSEEICAPLSREDHVPQPIVDVSPPKWHLGHTTWFYEQMILERYVAGYTPLHPEYAWVFNSYYDSFGVRVERPQRGALSRPTLPDVMAFRKYVDERMAELIDSVGESVWSKLADLLVLALNHEQQHQELLLTDLKYILACNPNRPAFVSRGAVRDPSRPIPAATVASFDGGLFEIGCRDGGFCYDNERPSHRVHLEPFELQNRLVTNGEYLAFVEDGGYEAFDHWLSDGWATVQAEGWNAPLYWEKRDGEWYEYTLYGLEPLDPSLPVCHVSYYEAEAFARWSDMRLPTEAEWEVAVQQAGLEPEADRFHDSGWFHPRAVGDSDLERSPDGLQQMFGDCWEWTGSAYLPYPGYRRVEGPFGEYNGKFMVNQMVLRGGAIATSLDHIRPTYRNFFAPEKRWQFKGIRLANHL